MANNTENRELAIKLTDVRKMYKLGQIGGGTLQADLQSWWAKKRGLEDPNTKIGEQRLIGSTFMALNGIDLEVYKGEALGIIGGNGAGKSTMLKLLSRVTAPTSGKIQIWGRIASMLEVGTGFNGEMTGRENVYMNGAILGMTKAEIDAKIEDIIEFSEVRDFIDTPVKRYSSGMYVKLAFSVAAHLDSEIMIMDEVLAVGDMAFQKKCLTKMREAAKLEGRTVLYVSHNMNTIRQLCDRCIVLDKGKVILQGDVEEAIRAYLGSASEELCVYYDLRETKRYPYGHGVNVRISSFEFLKCEKAVFLRSEPMQFRVTFQVFKAIPKLKLYLIISSESSGTIGAAQMITPICDGVEDSVYSVEAQFNIKQLTEGRYYLRVDICSTDDEGHHQSYDHPRKNIFFEVIDNIHEGIAWNHSLMGNINLGEIKQI